MVNSGEAQTAHVLAMRESITMEANDRAEAYAVQRAATESEATKSLSSPHPPHLPHPPKISKLVGVEVLKLREANRMARERAMAARAAEDEAVRAS